MRQKRAQFEYALRALCRRNINVRTNADKLASKLLNINTNDLWREVKHFTYDKTVQANSIDGHQGDDNVVYFLKNTILASSIVLRNHHLTENNLIP